MKVPRPRAALRKARASLRRRRSARPIGVDPNFLGFDKYAREGAYHWDEIESSPDYRAKAEFVQQFVAKSDEVLDIGCGDGAYVGFLAPGCQRIVGIDGESEAVHLATKMLRRAGATNAEARHLSISALNLNALDRVRPFDVVYSMDVIEHLPDPKELGEHIRSVTTPHSTVLIGTPTFLGDELVSPYHVREFTAEELLVLLGAYLEDMRLERLPMRRADGAVHDDGFLVVVGRPQATAPASTP